METYTLSKFGNWATKVCKIMWFLRKMSHIWSVNLQRNSLHAGSFFLLLFFSFVKILTRKHERLTAYLATEIQYTVFINWSSLKSLHCYCHKIGLLPVWKITVFRSHFIHLQAPIAQDTAVLGCCQLRTSRTAICAFRKVYRPVSELIYQELPIFLHFLTQRAAWNNFLWFALWPFSGSITTWIFDSLNHWCITGL